MAPPLQGLPVSAPRPKPLLARGPEREKWGFRLQGFGVAGFGGFGV